MKSGETILSNCKFGIATQSGTTYTIHNGSANVSGVVVDTAGWSGIVFVITSHSGVTSASATFKVQGAATSASCAADSTSSSGWDLTDTAVYLQTGSATDSSGSGSAELLLIEVNRPVTRYVRLYAMRDTSASTFTATYMLYGPTGFASNPIPIENTNAGRIGVTSASAGNIQHRIAVSPAQASGAAY